MWRSPQYTTARGLGNTEWFEAPPLRGAAALTVTRIQERARRLYKKTTRDEEINQSPVRSLV